MSQQLGGIDGDCSYSFVIDIRGRPLARLIAHTYCFQARPLRGGRLLGSGSRFVSSPLSSLGPVEVLLEMPLSAARAKGCLRLTCSYGHVESSEQYGIHVSCAVHVQCSSAWDRHRHNALRRMHKYETDTFAKACVLKDSCPRSVCRVVASRNSDFENTCNMTTTTTT